MNAFRVLKPGLFTVVQDSGRFGYLNYGVPISGAMDTFSLVASNLLVANDERSACLETTVTGPELQALGRTQIAITGGICSPKINGHRVPMWQTLAAEEGDVVSFGRMESGCRAYVAMRGGIDSPVLLGSRSTYVRGGFGGTDGRQLKAGDLIKGLPSSLLSVDYQIPEELIPLFTDHLTIHVVLGPQADMFTKSGIEAFLSSQYRVTLEADRMGYRLEGPTIEHKGKAEIVSDALLPGAIQVPKNGEPIVMMRDAQTTGGYPKIAVAITPDLDLLGQAKPDDEMQFSKTTVKQAHERIRRHRDLLSDLSLTRVKDSA
jgi:antagonist of KipI